jgi:hypothetical protein
VLWKTLVVAALGLGVVLAARSPAQEQKKDTKDSTGSVKGEPPAGKVPPYVHVVIFQLKKEAPAGEADALIRDSHAMLAKIPSVRRLWVGRPADKATPVAQKEYEVGVLVLFDNHEGLKSYLDHSLHVNFLRKHAQFWDEKKLRVYDFMNQMK